MGVNREKTGKVNMKSARQRQKMTGMNDKEFVVGELLQADPSKITVKDPTLPSGQFLKPYEKFKLQLFPIDEVTRRVLQEHNHNPYLELTLRPRKKISSVVKHLNIKWRISGKTSRELVLFPYETQTEDIVDHRRWSLKDTEISAADVFMAVGQPEVFRLRYGWATDAQIGTFTSPTSFTNLEDNLQSEEEKEDIKSREEVQQPCSSVPANELVNSDLCKPVPTDGSVKAVQNPGVGSNSVLSWIDCMTNVSMGQLLSETSHANVSDPLRLEQKSSSKQIFMNCDSFDAAIADLIARNRGSHHPTHVLHSSIWEAEETRHAFPIQEASSSRNGDILTSCGRSPTQVHAPEEPVVNLPDMDLKSESQDDDCQAPTNPQHEPQVSQNDTSNLGLSNICWGDTLGPFEFGMSSKHVSGGDSINLSSLIASSSDASQNC